MSQSRKIAVGPQITTDRSELESGSGGRLRKRNITLAAGLALGSFIPLLVTVGPWVLSGREIDEFNTIDKLYYSVADRICEGQVPYRDFPLEYPIGSLPQILLPILVGRSMPAYRIGYIGEMLLVNALLLQVVAWQVGQREGEAAVAGRLGWYFLCFFFLCRMIVSRIDLVPGLIALLAALGWAGGRPIAGGVLAALGGLVKIFPVLAAVPGALQELLHPRTTRLKGSLAFAGTGLLGMVLWYGVGGSGATASLLYHAERGLEVESLYAGPLLLLGRLSGEPMAVELGHGSYELISARAPGAVAASRYVQLLVLAASVAPFLLRRHASALQCSCALILGLVLASPVFSPQFIIWVFPLMCVLCGPPGRRARPLYAAICVLTFLIYPVFFHRGLVPMRLPAILLLNLRNTLLVVLWGLVAFGAGSTAPSAEGSGHRRAPAD